MCVLLYIMPSLSRAGKCVFATSWVENGTSVAMCRIAPPFAGPPKPGQSFVSGLLAGNSPCVPWCHNPPSFLEVSGSPSCCEGDRCCGCNSQNAATDLTPHRLACPMVTQLIALQPCDSPWISGTSQQKRSTHGPGCCHLRYCRHTLHPGTGSTEIGRAHV